MDDNRGGVTPQLPDDRDERPPLGGSWRRLYGLVLVWLAFLILIFWLFTRAFS
jgi:hypothetical protein